MSYEKEFKEYNDALNRAVNAKKRYLSAALRAETEEYLSQIGGFTDHKAYREKVLPYWERFGYKPDEFWFEFSGSRDQVMDPGFMPLDLLYNEIVPYLNNMQFRTAISDKAYYDVWFPDVKQAVTVCRRVAGIYYDGGMDIISEAEAVERCLNSSCVLFIKPALYTCGSKGITAVDPCDLTAEDLKGMFYDTGMNFIVQQEIEQHPELAVLNPDSVCTVRINTLLMDDKVHILTEVMRVGGRGEKVPLHGEGSYFAQILDDGRLHEKVLFRDPDESSLITGVHITWRSAEDYGLYDGSYRVPEIDDLRELAKKLHMRLAHFRFIGWDLTLDKDGDPVLIEFNLSPGTICGQLSACTPIFGDMTDRVLEDFFFERSLENTQKRGLLVQ